MDAITQEQLHLQKHEGNVSRTNSKNLANSTLSTEAVRASLATMGTVGLAVEYRIYN